MAVLAQVAVGGAFINVPTVVRHAYLSVALWTDAHERSDQIFASEFAVVGRCGALVDILTMAAICSQSVTVGTNTTERSRDVVATESTLVAHFLTFVDIFADLHRSRSESFSTVTFESSLDVSASTVAANVGHGAFVVVYNMEFCKNCSTFSLNINRTNAFAAAAVQNESHRTFATERSVRVDAFTTFANARHNATLVKILSFRSATGTTGTQLVKFSLNKIIEKYKLIMI